jgi:5-methylthioadenosine/S-adenosylhomocysteine deaminase
MNTQIPALRQCDYVLEAACILTQDKERRIFEYAALAVDQGRILAVGPAREITAAYAARERISLGNSLLMPGLVNAHTHAAMSLLRGYADDLPLLEWLRNHIFPLEQRLNPEIVEWGTLLGCAEMIRTGTTAFCDMYIHENASLRGADRSGLRCLAAEGLFGFPSGAYASVDEGFDLARKQHAQWKDHPRIAVAVGPHAVYTTTPQFLARCAELAAELKAPIMMHVAESAAESAQSMESFGKRPLAICHEAGLLGPFTTLAHAVDINDEEMDILVATKTCVAHNPRSNMKLASGVNRFDDMRQRGIPVALGTDGASSNNQLNMFMERSACALLHKNHQLRPTAAPAQAVLDAATLGGAHALGIVPGHAHSWSGFGTFTPGAPADCIALDLNSPNLQPMYAPSSHLVYAATGHEVNFNMVNGRVLYHDGKFAAFDYDALLKEVKKLHSWVLAQR